MERKAPLGRAQKARGGGTAFRCRHLIRRPSATTTYPLKNAVNRVSKDLPGVTFVLTAATPALVSNDGVNGILTIRRYPDHQTGLGRWDFDLLKYAKEKGPKVTRVIGETMGLNFDADLMGDAYLFWRLRRLADSDLAHPLVALSGDPYNMRDCKVAITEAGELVLADRANAIELNGIDDWVLGVHLDSRQGAVWFRKESTLVSG